jgi:hypothetical protein
VLATIWSRTFCLLVFCKKNLKIRIHKMIILPVVLYGCETWSLTLREEHRQGAEGISGPKRAEPTGE